MVNEILTKSCGSKKPESKTPLGRSELRWKRNIKTGLKQMWKMSWTRLIWPRIGIISGLL